MEQTKSFSRNRPVIKFEIDGDTFTAASGLPAGTLAEFGTRYADAGSDNGIKEQFKTLSSVLELVLLPDSYTLFTKRLSDPERPIDMDQLNEVIMWLLEQYGMRPTVPASASFSGSPHPELGTSSTDGAPGAA